MYLDELYKTARTWANGGYQALFSPYQVPGNEARHDMLGGEEWGWSVKVIGEGNE